MEKESKTPAESSAERFSFALKEADIKDVLRGLSKQTNYNVIVEPDVKGLCTVDLKDVTLIKALEYILEPLDFTFKIEEKSIYVSKPKLETKIFSLNYVALKKVGTSSVVGSVGGGGTSSTIGSSSEYRSVEVKNRNRG